MKHLTYHHRIIIGIVVFIIFILCLPNLSAQCSICTRSAQQLGPNAGRGLNAGILYLMLIPLTLLIIIGLYIRKRLQ